MADIAIVLTPSELDLMRRIFRQFHNSEYARAEVSDQKDLLSIMEALEV